jgi:hypothetical protein
VALFTAIDPEGCVCGFPGAKWFDAQSKSQVVSNRKLHDASSTTELVKIGRLDPSGPLRFEIRPLEFMGLSVIGQIAICLEMADENQRVANDKIEADREHHIELARLWTHLAQQIAKP